MYIIVYRVHDNLAVEVLHAHYEELLHEITHPCSLATELLKRQIIDPNIGDAILSEHFTKRDKVVMLLDNILATTCREPAHFHTLIKLLEEKPSHNLLGRLLQQSYGRYI